MVYVCDTMKLYIDGCILSFMEKVKAKRYRFVHSIADNSAVKEFEVYCDAPTVTSPGDGITMSTDNINIFYGDFKEEFKSITYPYGSMFSIDKGKIFFMVKDNVGVTHWYSYIPILEV